MDTVVKIGQRAPQFELPDLDGHLYSLEGLKGWIRVINFWSAECTWCERVDHELISHLDAWKTGVKVIWIASNANESRELIVKVARERDIPIALWDANQKVSNLYGAQTTPHFFVVDAQGILAYQGAWDDITFRKRVATQIYVPQVVEALSQRHTPVVTQTPPYGCVLVRISKPSA